MLHHWQHSHQSDLLKTQIRSSHSLASNEKKKIKWFHILFRIKTNLFTMACEVLIIWLCYPLSSLFFFWKFTRLLFLKHAEFINISQLLHLISLPGTLFHRLSQGCFLFAIRVSAQMSLRQESISLPLIQSQSHFSDPLCHIIPFNCMNRVYCCDASLLFIFAKGK